MIQGSEGSGQNMQFFRSRKTKRNGNLTAKNSIGGQFTLPGFSQREKSEENM